MRSHGVLLAVVLIVSGLALTVTGLTPLACPSRANAVSVIRAAAVLRADSDFEVDLPTFDWDTELVTVLHLVQAYDNVTCDTIRRREFEPNAWCTTGNEGVVLYGDPAVTVNCTEATALVPPHPVVKDIVMEVMSYLRYVAQSRRCVDVNEVPYRIDPNDPTNKAIGCDCLPDKQCRGRGAVIEATTTAIDATLLALGILVTLFALVKSIWPWAGATSPTPATV